MEYTSELIKNLKNDQINLEIIKQIYNENFKLTFPENIVMMN